MLLFSGPFVRSDSHVLAAKRGPSLSRAPELHPLVLLIYRQEPHSCWLSGTVHADVVRYYIYIFIYLPCCWPSRLHFDAVLVSHSSHELSCCGSCTWWSLRWAAGGEAYLSRSILPPSLHLCSGIYCLFFPLPHCLNDSRTDCPSCLGSFPLGKISGIRHIGSRHLGCCRRMSCFLSALSL